jgi:hypothetical protein
MHPPETPVSGRPLTALTGQDFVSSRDFQRLEADGVNQPIYPTKALVNVQN